MIKIIIKIRAWQKTLKTDTSLKIALHTAILCGKSYPRTTYHKQHTRRVSQTQAHAIEEDESYPRADKSHPL